MKTIAYSVTKHRVKMIVHLARRHRAMPSRARAWSSARWVEPERLGEYTFSSAGRRLIAWITSSLRIPSAETP